MIKIINSGTVKYVVSNIMAYDKYYDGEFKTIVMFPSSTFQLNEFIVDIPIDEFETFLYDDEKMITANVKRK